MTTYESGTVAVATVNGEPNVRVWWIDRSFGWTTAEPVGPRDSRFHQPDEVTDVRPLVVLDLDGYDDERAVTYLRNLARDSRDVYGQSPSPRGKLANLIADQIEAQTKPPRIPEPGLWGVVTARLSRDADVVPSTFVRGAIASVSNWTEIGAADHWTWDDLVDPVLVRDGIEDTP